MTEPKGPPNQPDKQPGEKEPEPNRGTLPDLDPGEAALDIKGGGIDLAPSD